jgi:hypothetical protein
MIRILDTAAASALEREQRMILKVIMRMTTVADEGSSDHCAR